MFMRISAEVLKLLRYLIKDTIVYSCRRSERFGVRMELRTANTVKTPYGGLTRIIEVIDFTLSNRAIDRENVSEKCRAKSFKNDYHNGKLP